MSGTSPAPAADAAAVEQSVRGLTARHATEQRNWYRARKKLPRRLFRTSGVTVIIASVLIPVIAQIDDFPWRDTLLSGLGVLVAVLTSLGSFFSWDQVWKSYRVAESALDNALAKWELEVERAKLGLVSDPPAHLFASTEDLLARTYSVVQTEEGQYFDTVRPVDRAASGPAT